MDKEAKNVYIITQGCYSDYHIVTVFDDEDKAKAFVEVYNKNKRSEYVDDYEIETYKINSIDIRSSEGKLYFNAWTDARGTLYVEPTPEYDPERVGVVNCMHRALYVLSVGLDVPVDFYSLTVFAENIDKARKIAADKIAEYKANEEAIT